MENHGSHGGFSSDYSDDHHHSENNDNRTDVNCHVLNGEASTSHSGHGIEITLLSASSPVNPQSFNTSGMVLKELFGPGATAGTTLLGQCQSIDQQSSDLGPNGSIFTMEVSALLVLLSLDVFLNTSELFPLAHVSPSTYKICWI